MTKDQPVGVFVNRMNWGEKYLFASVSIPDHYIQPGTVDHPADLGKLLRRWYEAYEAQRLPATGEGA